MRQPLSLDPTKWLSSAPIPIPSPQSVLSSFVQYPPVSVERFTGPHKLYRMSGLMEKPGGIRQPTDPYGSWWVDEEVLRQIYNKISRFDMYEGWMRPELLADIQSLPTHYRALLAVCQNWNDLSEQVALVIPEHQDIIGLCGPTQKQPLRDNMDRKSRNTPWLPGGFEQVYFKVDTDAKRKGLKWQTSINPFWVYFEKLW